MKKLNIYIEELLYRHQCVIVPDFGAFIANRKAAELTQDKMFAPPQKELTFNARLTYNDGLLAKHISETERKSYEEAQSYIKEQAEEWFVTLKEGKPLNFENLGSFIQGVDGNIIFTPSNKENFLTESFGMSTFAPQQVNKEEEQTPVMPPLQGEATQENPMVSPEEAQAGKPKRKLPTIIKYAAVGVVALSAISYGVYMYLYNNPFGGNEVAQVQPDPKVVEQKVQERIRNEASFIDSSIEIQEAVVIENVTKDPKLAKKLAEEAKKKAKEEAEAQRQAERQALAEAKAREKEEKQAERQALAETKKKEEPQTQPATTTTAEKVSGNFHLIAGAFSSEQNAKKRIKELNQNGYSGASLVGLNAKGLHMVAYQSFQTKEEAETAAKDYKSKGTSTWVYASN